ncbi:hypothetical protein GRI97_10840 [Altererythrobacter xixiisoli]|uniref:Uncharacterized protein n=1 Tax=Croceibacterium xixiisoli TaxID=1476466 RepID=A0A6I4TU94_9SPHN|nr:hypothetical protein [Croceibacterium xixiisoli]MXO99484.1 hypothetical protein [Croceibacterium xixiisoli]
MHHFQILPIDQAVEPMDFIGFDAAGVLQAVQHLACTGARVLRDGAYCFDLRLDGSGVWHVSQQADATAPRLVSQSASLPTMSAATPMPPQL